MFVYLERLEKQSSCVISILSLINVRNYLLSLRGRRRRGSIITPGGKVKECHCLSASHVSVCVCVELVFLSLFLFEVIAVSIMQAEKGGVREGREKRDEWETEREERVGQQPRQRKAINKQTDWNTGIGILVFPAPSPPHRLQQLSEYATIEDE